MTRPTGRPRLVLLCVEQFAIIILLGAGTGWLCGLLVDIYTCRLVLPLLIYRDWVLAAAGGVLGMSVGTVLMARWLTATVFGADE